jgi:hypothetical protein
MSSQAQGNTGECFSHGLVPPTHEAINKVLHALSDDLYHIGYNVDKVLVLLGRGTSGGLEGIVDFECPKTVQCV